MQPVGPKPKPEKAAAAAVRMPARAGKRILIMCASGTSERVRAIERARYRGQVSSSSLSISKQFSESSAKVILNKIAQSIRNCYGILYATKKKKGIEVKFLLYYYYNYYYYYH